VANTKSQAAMRKKTKKFASKPSSAQSVPTLKIKKFAFPPSLVQSVLVLKRTSMSVLTPNSVLSAVVPKKKWNN
jgi:hypothetical protein